jgi:hypothetical protein
MILANKDKAGSCKLQASRGQILWCEGLPYFKSYFGSLGLSFVAVPL